MSNESATIWVCDCCMLNHANGECGCDSYYGEDPDHDPLNLVEGFRIAMGMAYEGHSEDCHNRIEGEWRGECDCETNTYSTSPCQGCGSWSHGKRHAMTIWL